MRAHGSSGYVGLFSLSLSDIIIVKDIYFDAIRNHTATSSTHVLSLTIKTGCDISSFGCYISVISYPLSIYLYICYYLETFVCCCDLLKAYPLNNYFDQTNVLTNYKDMFWPTCTCYANSSSIWCRKEYLVSNNWFSVSLGTVITINVILLKLQSTLIMPNSSSIQICTQFT